MYVCYRTQSNRGTTSPEYALQLSFKYTHFVTEKKIIYIYGQINNTLKHMKTVKRNTECIKYGMTISC